MNNIIKTLFVFWHIWIDNCLKVTSGDKVPRIEEKGFLEMENNLKEFNDETLNWHHGTKSVYGYDHDNHLCYLCDTCDNQDACSRNGLDISSRNQGKNNNDLLL